MRLIALAAAAAAALIIGGAASAATTVYPVSHFSNAGVANPNRLLGNNPNTNNIQRNDSIGLNYGTDIIKFTLSFVVTNYSGNTTWLWVRPGRRGLLTFTNASAPGLLAPNGTATQNLYVQITGPGTYWINTDVYESSCHTIGGCNAIMFGNSSLSQNGSNFQVSVVGATPEPQAWALMILGFCGVAARLKHVRQSRETALAAA